MALYELTTGKDFVKLGDKVFSEYEEVPRKPFSFNSWLEEEMPDCYVKCWDDRSTPAPKFLNKKLHEMFGSKITLRLNAALYNTFIKANFPKETYFAINRQGRHWRTFPAFSVNHALKNKHLVDQAVKDNTINLLPLMLEFEEDTQQLRKRFGKGLWKKLAHTSKTRMRHLAPLLRGNTEVISLRTGILPLISLHDTKMIGIEADVMVAAKVAPRVKDFYQTFDIVRDTMIMARRQGIKLNHDWSWRRWQQEHDLLSWKIAKDRYPSNKFVEDCIFTEGGYTFTLLTSQADIASEGMQMRHCVASYAHKASQGKYAVFKIDGKERATLGLDIHSSRATLNQCYGYCNKTVSDELQKTLPLIVRMFDDIIRLRNGRTSSSSDKSSCPVMDNGW